MTKYFVKKLFSEFYSFNIKLLLVIAVFSFYSTYNLSVLDSSGCSVFEYALLGMSDHYYTVFFFLVMYIVIMIGSIKDSNDFVVMRNGRYYSYYLKKLIAIALFSISIVFFHAILITIIGSFKHGWVNCFSSELSPYISVSELSAVFRSCFSTPLAALVSVCLYLSLGLCVISGSLMLVSHCFSEKVVILSGICIYLIIVVTLQLNIDRVAPLFFINNYLFLHRAISYGMPVMFSAVSIGLIALLLLLANRQRGYLVKHITNLFSPVKIFGEMISLKNIITIVSVLVVLAILNVIKFKADANSGAGYTLMLFWGYGLGYLNIIDFFHLIIINGIPVYILAAYLGNKASMRSIVMIRYGRMQKWFSSIQLSMLIVILLHLTMLCLFSLLIGFVNSNYSQTGSDGMLFSSVNSLYSIAVGLVLRTFEIMFLQMVFLVATSLLKSITISYFLTMFLYLSVAMFSYKYIPFGLSSLCRVLEISDKGLLFNTFSVLAVFAGFYMALLVYMIKIGAHRIQNYERI